MTKEEFFQDLEEIVTAPLFICSGKSEYDNMWCISISSDLAKIVTAEDFDIFFKKVISSRRTQAKALNPATSMLFYLWFDEQASQLRFNIISDTDKGPPFGCKVIHTTDCTAIFEDFLKYPYHDGIPIPVEYTIINDNSEIENNNKEYSLKVYCVEL